MQEIPVKKSDAVSFTRALSQFVVNSYSVDASIYSDDFKDLDKLRADAISDNSLKSMFRYYTQLSGISVKFPLNEDSGIKLSFAWYSIFGGCYSCYSIDHDKASILFNIGATYSLLGKESDRSSDSGLKSAVHHFQNAAGVFKHLAESINTLKVPLYNDFSKLVLESFQNQMLAQAQECFFLKSLSLKDVLIARISRKVSELYTTSYKLATETNSFSKGWLAYLFVKLNYFEAIASYHKSKEALNAAKYGLELGWLNISNESLSKCVSSVDLVSQSLKEDFVKFQDKITKLIASSTKDNDLIYMDRIVYRDSLPVFTGAEMTTATPPPDLETLKKMGYVSPTLFKNLVPFGVHKAASLYSSKMDARLRDLTLMIEYDESKCLESLAEMRLPSSLEAIRNTSGCPQFVIDRSNEIKSKGFPAALNQNIGLLFTKSQICVDSLESTRSILYSEENSDSEIRNQYGEKWNRKTSREIGKSLFESVDVYSNKLASAQNSDNILKSKLESSYISMLEFCNINLVSSELPSIKLKSDPSIKAVSSRLELIDDIVRKRRDLLKEIKSIASKDDILPFLTNQVSLMDLSKSSKIDVGSFEDAFNSRLNALFENSLDSIEKLKKNQCTILSSLETANIAFTEFQKTDASFSIRERKLNAWNATYCSILQISDSLNQGMKFYSEFEGVLMKFQTNVKDFVFARDVQKKDLMEQVIKSSVLSQIPPPGLAPPGLAPSGSYT